MRVITLLAAVFMSFGLLALGVACSEEDEPSAKDRVEFQQDVEKRIDELDSEISDLKQRVEAQGEDTRNDLEARLDDLEDERKELEGQVDRLRNASDEEWQEIKGDIGSALDDLEERIKDF
jgi:septal ring factor EnvC (AmiA/AmiB activator)